MPSLYGMFFMSLCQQSSRWKEVLEHKLIELPRRVLLMILELLLVICDFSLAELNSTARKRDLPFMKSVNFLSVLRSP
jgi:hypothetical protein